MFSLAISFEKYSRCENKPFTVELKTVYWLFTFVFSERSLRTAPRRTGIPSFELRSLLLIPLIKDFEVCRSAISKHLFSRKDLLETTIRLADIAALKNGYAFQSSKYDTKGKWKILTIADVSGERYINDDDCNCIINLPNDIQGHQVLKEGDILISLTGNVGRVSLCKAGNILLNQRVGLLCITKNVNQEFLYQVLSSRRFENSMVACGQGAAQMNIGKGDVENFVLPYSSNANNIHLVARILHSYDECIINEYCCPVKLF